MDSKMYRAWEYQHQVVYKDGMSTEEFAKFITREAAGKGEIGWELVSITPTPQILDNAGINYPFMLHYKRLRS